MIRPWVIALACTLAACASDEGPTPLRLPDLTAVTFNVHGSDAIQDPVVGQQIADQLVTLAPQFVALQECVSCKSLLEKMPIEYGLVGGGDSAIGIMYVRSDWDVVDEGTILLGANDDGWGRREALWAEFSHVATGASVLVYSTHWCVTIRNSDDACDTDRQIEYARVIVESFGAAHVILAGDLNVFDGFERGPVIDFLLDHGLVDTLREVDDSPAVTFKGNDWAPAGRIDYVLSTAPVEVISAAVMTQSASDHFPVSATVRFR